MHALNGLYLAFRTQKNFRKHILIAVFVLIAAVILKAKPVEFAIIIFANGSVLVIELINSVIEFIMDAYYKNKYSRLCKFAKDISAGAVMFASVISILTGVILFGSKLF